MARAGGGHSGGSRSGGSMRSSGSRSSTTRSSGSRSGASTRSSGRSGGSHPGGAFRTNGSFSSGSKSSAPRSGASSSRPGGPGTPPPPGRMGGPGMPPPPGYPHGPGMPPPPPPRPRRRFFGGYYGPGPGPRRRGGGCLSFILALIITFIVLGVVVFSRVQSDAPHAPADTYTSGNGFVPLDKSAVHETAYYTDDLGWIEDPQTLESGLSYFYSMTGIQPHIYLTDVDYSTDDGIDLYYDLFDDEGHFLFILYGVIGNDNYENWYVTPILGDDAADAMDPYLDTFWDQYDENYENQELSAEEVLSRTFRETADEISQYIVTDASSAPPAGSNEKAHGSILLSLIVILIVVVIIVVIVRSRKNSASGTYSNTNTASGGSSKEGGYTLNGEYHSYDEKL